MRAILLLIFVVGFCYGQDTEPLHKTPQPKLSFKSLSGTFKDRMKEREHLLNTTDEHLLYVCEELVRNFSKTSDMEGRLQHLEILWILVNRLRVATVGAVEDYYYDSEEVDRETRKSFFRFWIEDRGLKTDLKYK